MLSAASLDLVYRPTPTPGAPPAALHSGGGIVDDTGIMTDGAGVPTGTPLSDPPLVAAISEDPVLRDVKLIAEAWDCDGLYQVRLVCGLEEGSGGAGWCRRDGAAC